MATNLYWLVPVAAGRASDETDVDDPQIHIGKRSGSRFLWAEDSKRVLERLQAERNERYVAVDERGKWYSPDEVMEIIAGAREVETSTIGQWFS